MMGPAKLTAILGRHLRHGEYHIAVNKTMKYDRFVNAIHLNVFLNTLEQDFRAGNPLLHIFFTVLPLFKRSVTSHDFIASVTTHDINTLLLTIIRINNQNIEHVDGSLLQQKLMSIGDKIIEYILQQEEFKRDSRLLFTGSDINEVHISFMQLMVKFALKPSSFPDFIRNVRRRLLGITDATVLSKLIYVLCVFCAKDPLCKQEFVTFLDKLLHQRDGFKCYDNIGRVASGLVVLSEHHDTAHLIRLLQKKLPAEFVFDGQGFHPVELIMFDRLLQANIKKPELLRFFCRKAMCESYPIDAGKTLSLCRILRKLSEQPELERLSEWPELFYAILHLLNNLSFSHLDKKSRNIILHAVATWRLSTQYLNVKNTLKRLLQSIQQEFDKRDECLCIGIISAFAGLDDSSRTIAHLSSKLLSIALEAIFRYHFDNLSDKELTTIIHVYLLSGLPCSYEYKQRLKARICSEEGGAVSAGRLTVLSQALALGFFDSLPGIPLGNNYLSDANISRSESHTLYCLAQTVKRLFGSELVRDHVDGGLSIDGVIHHEGKIIAVNIDGPFHYYDGGRQLTKKSRLRNRLQDARGYIPLNLPYYELDNRGDARIMTYLEKVLTEVLGNGAQDGSESYARSTVEGPEQLSATDDQPRVQSRRSHERDSKEQSHRPHSDEKRSFPKYSRRKYTREQQSYSARKRSMETPLSQQRLLGRLFAQHLNGVERQHSRRLVSTTPDSSATVSLTKRRREGEPEQVVKRIKL